MFRMKTDMERVAARIPNTGRETLLATNANHGAGDSLTTRLLRQGKIRAALNRAKSIHKSRPMPETEAQLLHCYAERLRELRAAGQKREAEAMAAFITASFPNGGHMLERAQFAAQVGNDAIRPEAPLKPEAADLLGRALTRLADAGLPPKERSTAEADVARLALDPFRLAEHPSLVPGHPLAVAAKAVADAFSAVVSRPVPDAEIALPEVPRRSPLAGWKLLIRAIAHLQRREDDRARVALDRLVSLDAVPSQLVPDLRAIVDALWPQVGRAAARVLAPWRPREKKLASVMERLDSAIAQCLERGTYEFSPEKTVRRAEKGLLASLKEAATAVRLEAPALVIRFREKAATTILALTHLSLPKIERAMGGPTVRSASFWRLAALAMEARNQRWREPKSLARACDYWDAFRRHGAAEGLFAPGGEEEAEVYLHLADLIMNAEAYAWSDFRRSAYPFDAGAYYDAGQPAAIAELKPSVDAPPVPLDPMALFAAATKLAPTTENFRSWLGAARQVEDVVHWKRGGINCGQDPMARALDAWQRALPGDPSPWIILMSEAEERNALTLAQKHLVRAEAIDPLNADLARAKWRLSLAMCRRHLKQGKRHLVAADIEKMDTLRGHAPDGANWLLTGLRWLTESDRPDQVPARHAELSAAIGGDAGEYAAWLLENGIMAYADASLHPGSLPVALSPPSSGDMAAIGAAMARTARIMDESGFAFGWNKNSPWPDWFVKIADRLPKAELPALMNAMFGAGRFKAIFALGSVGLAAAGRTALAGHMLFLRAKALREGGVYQYERTRQCLRAAVEIARRANDDFLLSRVIAWVRKKFDSLRSEDMMEDLLDSMSAEELDDVLRIERENAAFPAERARDPHCKALYRRDFDSGRRCPEARSAREGELLPDGGDDPDFDLMEVVADAARNQAPQLVGAVETLLRENGLSKKGAGLLAPIIMPKLLTALATGDSIGGGIGEFLEMHPELRGKVDGILPGLSLEDRLAIEGGRILHGAGRSDSKRKRRKKR